MAVRFYHEFLDRTNYLNRIEIDGESWGGGASEIIASSGHPIITRHAGEKAGRGIIKGREVQFEFFVLPEDYNRYDDIFESDYGDYRLRHYVGGLLIFDGWLLPDNLSREYFKDKYVMSLSATDGLAKLQNTTFLTTNDEIIEGIIYQLEVIKYAIEKIGLELDFRVQLGTYESALMGASDCALAVIGCDTRRFYPGGKPMTCGQVIEAILKPYSCTLMQQDGFWQITNIHEGDSMQFTFNYGSLAQTGRAGTSKIVDLTGYAYESAEMSKIGPLREFGIIARTRDLGSDQTGLDLTDWANDWTITFDSWSEINGTIELDSGSGYGGHYIEPDTDFHLDFVFPDNENDYITVTLNYYVETVVRARPPPLMLIQLKHPGGYYASPVIIDLIPDGWKFVDLRMHPLMKQITYGDHNVRFTFDHTDGSAHGNYLFRIRNVKISVITNAAGNPDVDAVYSIDEYHRQTTGRNLEIEEVETLFADGRTETETGALLHNLTTLTSVWNTYGGGEGIALLDIWARNELNNRYRFKDYLKLTVHDLNNTIDIDSLLIIAGKTYSMVSYYKDHKMCMVECDIEELLLTKNSYNVISTHELTSVEGEDISGSSNANVYIGIHNYLIDIQGGIPNEYYHLSLAEHTELTAWLDNVILSDAGGIDMDGDLEVDQILEHTPDAGVMVEMINFSTAEITTSETNMTFQDGSTGPHSLSDLVGGAPAAHAASHESGGGDLVDHNNLTNYVADRHINHISVTLVAGTGLSGGGTINATRTFNLDLSDLTAITTLQITDYFGLYDTSISGTRRISYANLITNLNSGLNFSPLSHTHGNITNAGAIGTTATLPIITTTSGVLTVGSFGTGGGAFCQGNDARLSDSRTPTAHASSHHTGGSDLVNHDSLTGFVANEHINHYGVYITTGTTSGLSGGANIDASMTLLLAVNRLTAITTLQSTDYFPFYDASGAGTRRISYANMITALNNDLSFGTHMTWSGGGSNRVGTYGSATSIEGEPNLTFDGSILTVTGDIGLTGTLKADNITEFTTDAGILIPCQLGVDNNVLVTGQLGVGSAPYSTAAGTFKGASAEDHWFNTLIAYDNRAMAAGIGGGISFGGKYKSDGTYTMGGFVRIEKENATTDQYGFDMLIGNRINGGSAVAQIKIHASDGSVEIINNLGIAMAPPTGAYYRVNIGGTTTITASESGSLDLEVNNTHSTGSTRFVLAVNDENKFTVLQLNYTGDGLFKLGLGDIIWGWDSSANMGIGTTDTESTARLYCAANKISGYAAHFFNDGNSVNRYGIKISCGTDNQAGTVNYFLRGFAGGQITEEGGLRNSSGTFAVYQGSDRRRKKNIVDTEIDTARILSGLKIRDYNRIGSKGKLSNKQTGWIAQEVAEIFPAMYGYTKDTDLHSVTPTELIPVLHRGWQLHEEKLTEHQKKINRMERHILTLESEIKNLKKNDR